MPRPPGGARTDGAVLRGGSLSTAVPQIPYGWADFEAMRRERTLYVDKTRFLHDLEQERYAFLIRPRRFGKSCWVALMACYYDRTRADHHNTGMVLYYLKGSTPNKPPPDDLIDTNVRIDCGKLRHLLVTGRRLNGNFDLLRHVIADGEAESPIQAGLPLDRLTRRENFLSLLHYFGLLSIRGVRRGTPRLGIPNQTVKRLMYGYLRDAWDDMGLFSVDFHELFRLTRDMAYEGAWRPAVEYLSGAVARQTAIRDYLDGEKVVQTFFAAYFGLALVFRGWELVFCEAVELP